MTRGVASFSDRWISQWTRALLAVMLFAFIKPYMDERVEPSFISYLIKVRS